MVNSTKFDYSVSPHNMEQNKNTSDVKPVPCHHSKDKGINNWILIFFAFYIINHVIDNYLRFGITINPLQLTTTFFEFIQEFWWIYVSLFLIHVIQIVICFIIEKALILGVLSESQGLSFHLINAFILLHSFAYFCISYQFNRIAAGCLAPYVGLAAIKLFAYPLANRRFRSEFHKAKDLSKLTEIADNKKTAHESLQHQQNISTKELFEYVLCSGSYVYEKKKKPSRCMGIDKRNVFCKIIYSIGIHFLLALLIHQYILPELHSVSLHISLKQYSQVLQVFFKLALPINIVWLVYYYVYLMRVYLAISIFRWSSIHNNVFASDWWNSENTTIFWRKWNSQIHFFFKEEIFGPILQMGYSKRQATCAVGLFTGLLHEYVWTIPLRIGYGTGVVGMMCQVPLSSLSQHICVKYGKSWGNLCVWLSFILPHTFYTILVCYYSTQDNVQTVLM